MSTVEPAHSVQDPPQTVLSSLRFLGPGFVLSAAVVGSGELIATTALGARAGFVLLWVILVSCTVKVAVQLQYGRHCIVHGLPSFQAWNATAGPRLMNLHWAICIGILFLLASFVSAGGIIGAAAQVLTHVLPGVRVEAWTVLLALLLGLLIFNGKYGQVEKISAFFNCVFVAAILYCNWAAQHTRYAFGSADLLSGLKFQLPPEGLALAAAVFGITGVGAGEIVMYPYWCLEKGYAAWAGPREDSPDWARRARGWIRVMQFDAMLSMAVYTIATCGFYFLGASILRPQGYLADGSDLLLQLSGIFTHVLGEGSRAVFLACAFTVLFSSLFSNAAGFSRLWADMLGVCRWIDPGSPAARRRAMAFMSWVLPSAWGLAYIVFQKPLYLVVFMGICNSLFLLVVAWQAVVFRYRHTDPRLRPSRWFDGALWLSIASIALVASRILWSAWK